jgi:hypothetical protein
MDIMTMSVVECEEYGRSLARRFSHTGNAAMAQFTQGEPKRDSEPKLDDTDREAMRLLHIPEDEYRRGLQ